MAVDSVVVMVVGLENVVFFCSIFATSALLRLLNKLLIKYITAAILRSRPVSLRGIHDSGAFHAGGLCYAGALGAGCLCTPTANASPAVTISTRAGLFSISPSHFGTLVDVTVGQVISLNS